MTDLEQHQIEARVQRIMARLEGGESLQGDEDTGPLEFKGIGWLGLISLAIGAAVVTWVGHRRACEAPPPN